MALQFLRTHTTGAGQPVQGVVRRGFVGRAVDFGPVAGREDGRFGRLVGLDRQVLAQAMQGRCQLVHSKSKPATQIERGGGVVQTQGPDGHVRIIKTLGAGCAV